MFVCVAWKSCFFSLLCNNQFSRRATEKKNRNSIESKAECFSSHYQFIHLRHRTLVCNHLFFRFFLVFFCVFIVVLLRILSNVFRLKLTTEWMMQQIYKFHRFGCVPSNAKCHEIHMHTSQVSHALNVCRAFESAKIKWNGSIFERRQTDDEATFDFFHFCRRQWRSYDELK